MQLRMLEQADLEPLSKLYTYYATKTVYTYFADEASPRYMRSLFSGYGHACAVAEENTKVIGYVHIAPSEFHAGHCTLAVYLDRTYVGQRRGEALVHYGENLAREMGYRCVDVGICTENERSRRLFARLGYHFTGTRRAEAVKFGRELDTAYYRKDLNEAGNETIPV